MINTKISVTLHAIDTSAIFFCCCRRFRYSVKLFVALHTFFLPV